MSSVAPLGCTAGAATGVPSSLGVELDPVFTFPGVDDTTFFFLERVMVSFDPLRRTVARVAVEPLSLEGDWTFLLSSFIVASTRLLLFVVLLSLISVFPVRSGSMFSFEGDLGNGLFGEPFAFAAVTGALL